MPNSLTHSPSWGNRMVSVRSSGIRGGGRRRRAPPLRPSVLSLLALMAVPNSQISRSCHIRLSWAQPFRNMRVSSANWLILNSCPLILMPFSPAFSGVSSSRMSRVRLSATMRNARGAKVSPCGTPEKMGKGALRTPLVRIVRIGGASSLYIVSIILQNDGPKPAALKELRR